MAAHVALMLSGDVALYIQGGCRKAPIVCGTPSTRYGDDIKSDREAADEMTKFESYLASAHGSMPVELLFVLNPALQT